MSKFKVGDYISKRNKEYYVLKIVGELENTYVVDGIENSDFSSTKLFKIYVDENFNLKKEYNTPLYKILHQRSENGND